MNYQDHNRRERNMIVASAILSVSTAILAALTAIAILSTP